MTDFREGGLFTPPPIREKPQKCSSWIGLNLAREYYGHNKLKQKGVRPSNFVDFEGIAKHHNVSIMLNEPKDDKEKDEGSIWRLAYCKI